MRKKNKRLKMARTRLGNKKAKMIHFELEISISQQDLGLTINTQQTGINHKAHKMNQQRQEGKRHNIKGPEHMRIR